ncbi:MAG: hypothetical protein V4724_35045 [Pseudomonadota bacterium]
MAALAFTLTLGTAAHAQKMYRCGNAYQDRPCEGNQVGKVIGGGGASSSSVQPVADAYCAQRGIDSQKISWSREGGALQEQLLAKSRKAAERQLIEDVYARRGSAPEVRASIEADCIAEKEKAARLGMSPDAVNARRSSAANASAPSPESDIRTVDASRARERAASEANFKKESCSNFKTELENIASRQRAGGTGDVMEYLNQQRRDIESKVRQTGC